MDLLASSLGAVRFGAWLAATSDSDEKLIGVHVLGADHLRAVLRYHHVKEVEQGAGQALRKVVAEAGLAEHFDELKVTCDTTAEQALTRAAQAPGVDGLIVGRQAPSGSQQIVRLGRVARRLLRALPGPTIAVPPDYDPAENPGPIVVSTNLTPDSAHAVAFAKAMCQRLGRPLVVVHVVPLPEHYAVHYLPEDSIGKIREENHREGQQQMDAWANEVDCPSCERLVLQGNVVEQILGLVDERKACLLVTGSRRLSGLERWLLTSIGSELASMARCPVAVVAPGQG